MIIWSDAILGFPCHNSEHVSPQNSSGRSSPNVIFPLAELVPQKPLYFWQHFVVIRTGTRLHSIKASGSA